MIFYFTGTGNSLYIARRLGKQLNDTNLKSIPQVRKQTAGIFETRQGGEKTAHNNAPRHKLITYRTIKHHVFADDAIGIVCPTYGHRMPQYVLEFISEHTFQTEYFYVVLTYGNRTCNAVERTLHELRIRGIECAFISTLLMVDNWLPGYDVEEQLSCDKNIENQIKRIAADLASKKRSMPYRSDSFLSEAKAQTTRAISTQKDESFNLYGEQIDWLLTISANCTGCGTCVKVCPSGCITLVNGRAYRSAGSGWGCAACLACIHACPHNAFELGLDEPNPHARFRNEHISLQDLISANYQGGR